MSSNRKIISFSHWLFLILSIFPMKASTPILAQEIFTDITTAAGVAGIGTGGHGLGIGDVNDDGLLDMYVTNSYGADTLINQLFINQGGNIFQDVAENIGVDDKEHLGGHGAVLVDIDNDQDVDIFIGNAGGDVDTPSRNTLFRNEGNLSFNDVTGNAGLASEYTATRGVAALDVDSDGDLDLVSSPFFDLITLYINSGYGYFQAEVRGIEDDTLFKQGISDIDIDGDGDIDLYVNKWGQGPNRLFLNDGQGFFTEKAESLGIDNNENNLGATFADIDNDGDLDLFVASRNTETSYLQVYRNENGQYINETMVHNIVSDCFTVSVGDVDNDGDLDLFVPRSYQDYALFMNDGQGFFLERSGSGVEVTGEDARSASFADFDNDGDLDLMVVQKRGYSHLFRNETNDSSFIEIRIIGPTGERYCMGTRAVLYEAGHAGDDSFIIGYRETSSTMAYLSQSSPVIHFGLGEQVNCDAVLSFPTGEEILLRSITPGNILDIDARNQSPQEFDLIVPEFGDTVMGSTVFLDWEDSFDPNPWDSVLYNLLYGTSKVFEPSSTYIEEGLAESEFTMSTNQFVSQGLSDLLPEKNKKYDGFQEQSDFELHIYWKVLAYDTRRDTTVSSPAQSHFWVVDGTGINGDDQSSRIVPKELTISQNYPNPFNPSTTLRVEVPDGGDVLRENVLLRIYSIRGRLVRTLFDGRLEPGTHRFTWNGLDDADMELPSGVYLAVLKLAGESKSIKMVLGK